MKRAFRWFIAICAISILLPIILLGLCYTAPMQHIAKELLVRECKQRTGHAIQIGSLRIRFPLRITISEMTIDSIATLHHLDTSLLPYPLLHGKASVPHLTIEQLTLHTDTLLPTAKINADIERISIDGAEYVWTTHSIQAHKVAVTDGIVAILLTATTKTDRTAHPFPLDVRVQNVLFDNIETNYSTPSITTTASVAHLRVNETHVGIPLTLSVGTIALSEGYWRYRPTSDSSYLWTLSEVSLTIDSACYSPTYMALSLRQLTLPDGIGTLPISIPQTLKSLTNTPTHATITLDGTLDTLHIQHCHLSLPTILNIELSGELSGLANKSLNTSISYRLHTAERQFVIPIPNSNHAAIVPRHTSCRGNLRYGPDTLQIQTSLALADGTIDLTAGYRPNAKRYNISAAIHTIDMQQLTTIDNLGTTTLQAALQGRGFDIDDSHTWAHGELHIDSLQWGSQTYAHANLQAELRGKRLQASCTYNDTLLHMQANATAWYSSHEIQAHMYAHVSDIDLKALDATTEEVHTSFRCYLTFNADSAGVYTLQGMLHDVVFNTTHRTTVPQSLGFNIAVSNESLSLAMQSSDLRLTLHADTYEAPWQWNLPNSIALFDYNHYINQLRAEISIGDDNPIGHYLLLRGLKFHEVRGTLYDTPQGIAAKIVADSLSTKSISANMVSCTARYTQGVLYAQIESGMLSWSNPMMQLSTAIQATAEWEGFSPDKLSGSITLSSLSYSLPTYSLLLRTKEIQTITYSHGRIHIDALRLYAGNKQPLTLNGNIALIDRTPILNLSLTTQDSDLLQSIRTPQALLFGSAILRGQVLIEGPISALSLSGHLSLRSGSSIHYIYKDAILAAGNQIDDVVTFTRFDQHDTATTATPYRQTVYSLSANIGFSIDPSVEIEIMIGASGQNTGILQGGGTLNLQYTPTNGVRLSGRYTIESGTLSMNVPLLHVHQMSIRPGSNIQWTGDIANPILDIAAEDRIRASVTLDGEPQSVLFVTGLSISDTVDKLNVLFTLAAPENASMQNTLAALSTDERNKLAVALLTTGLYLGEGGTGNLMNTALLGFLQSQLDNISRDAFRTVDVSVGIEPLVDGVSGVSTRTDYTYSIAKRFWNDRIRIVIGGSVTTSNERIASDAIINNISIEWRITPSGNQHLRFFYDKNFESILEGEIRETGIGYVYRRKF